MEKATIYERTQTGTGVLMGLGAGVALVVVVLFVIMATEGMDPIALSVLIVVLGIEALLMWLLGSMTIIVTMDDIRFHMGPGVGRKIIPIDDIRSHKMVNVPWYMGRGVKYTGNRTMYVIAGSHALELELRSGKVIWLGTGEPEALGDALKLAEKKK